MTDPTIRPATQNQIRSEQLMEALWGSADLGPRIRKVAKERFPDIRLPEETIDPVITPLREENEALKQRLDALSEKFEAREKETAESKTFRELEASVNAAVAKFGLTDEGRAAMLDRMKETRNFTDVEAAAAFIAHATPPQATAGPSWAAGPAKLNLFGSAEPEEQYKRLHTNPEGYLEDQLREFASNPDKYVTETFGRAA